MHKLPLPVAGLLVAAGAADAKEPDPKLHEVKAQVDIAAANQANWSLVDVQYTLSFGGIDRNDAVAPELRRFVRHPSAVWARFRRLGSTLDKRTGIGLGGVLYLLDGRLYGAGEVGIELDTVEYDPFEDGYFAAPFRLEIGGRPMELLSIGAVYEGRPVLESTDDPDLPPNAIAYRDGGEHFVGAALAFSLPTDRLYAVAQAGYWLADWTFENFHAGSIGAQGVRADVLVSLQSSRSTSWQFRLKLAREAWDNERQGDEGANYVGGRLERTVYGAEGEIALLYWFEGRHAFRVGLGGGYRGAEPIYYAQVNDVGQDLGFGKLLLGIVSRY